MKRLLAACLAAVALSAAADPPHARANVGRPLDGDFRSLAASLRTLIEAIETCHRPQCRVTSCDNDNNGKLVCQFERFER